MWVVLYSEVMLVGTERKLEAQSSPSPHPRMIKTFHLFPLITLSIFFFWGGGLIEGLCFQVLMTSVPW